MKYTNEYLSIAFFSPFLLKFNLFFNCFYIFEFEREEIHYFPRYAYINTIGSYGMKLIDTTIHTARHLAEVAKNQPRNEFCMNNDSALVGQEIDDGFIPFLSLALAHAGHGGVEEKTAYNISSDIHL